MKTPLLVVLTGLAGLTVAVRTLNRNPGDPASDAQTTYYANGQIDTECATKEGKREGLCRRFYADGRKLAEGRYVAGRMEGAWSFWLEDGSIDASRSGDYAAGTIVSAGRTAAP